MNPFKIFLVGLLCVFFAARSAYAQFFNAGQEPSGKKWSKISSTNFEVIFPEEFEKEGLTITGLLEKAYYEVGKSLKCHPKKVSVVLHNQTVKSNAFLGWAPSRIEMYTTPHQGIYAQDWLEQLAIHEFRHMVQLSKIEEEMPKLLYYLFGEQGAAMIVALHLPFWLIEGDAVSTETGLSLSGRGRLPDFYRETRTLLASNRKYSFSKSYLGSYKDFVPDYYRMGFLMTGGARYLYDKIIWDSVWTKISKRPLRINALDKALKTSLGLSQKKLYDTVYSHFQNHWSEEIKQLKASPLNLVSKPTKEYTNYLHGKKIGKNQYFAYKKTLNDIDHFVLLDELENSKKIFAPGFPFEESISASDSFVVWSEHLFHPRWEHSDCSLLRVHPFFEDKPKSFRFKNKIFAPSPSPDRKKVVVVESDDQYHFYLSIIDLANGEKVWSYQSPHNDYFINPIWSNDGKKILTVALRNNLKAIIALNIENKEIEELLPFANQEIHNPVEWNGKVLFVGGFSGVDNLYLFDPSRKKTSQLTRSRFGIDDPSVQLNQLVYSNYTINGYQLVTLGLDTLSGIPVETQDFNSVFPIAEKLSQQEGTAINFNLKEPVPYPIKPYSKLKNQFNFHSWAPVSIDPYNYAISPGISLLSQNKLSTTETLLAYRNDLENRHGVAQAKIKYMGLYPVIEGDFTYGRKSSGYNEIQQDYNHAGQIISTDTLKKKFLWDQLNIDLKVSLPLDFSRGRFFKLIEPHVRYQFSNINLRTSLPSAIFPSGNYHFIETGLYSYVIRKKSSQDLLPDFGLIASFNYQTSLEGVFNFGSQASLAGLVYLPGISANHGLKIYAGFQKKEPSVYSFSDKIRIARGHQRTINQRLSTFGADYLFPLGYPDMELGKILYLKRIKASFFYEQSWVSGFQMVSNQKIPYEETLQTSGIDLLTDLHLLRFIAPIEMGLRSSYLFGKGYHFDFLFNISFSL